MVYRLAAELLGPALGLGEALQSSPEGRECDDSWRHVPADGRVGLDLAGFLLTQHRLTSQAGSPGGGGAQAPP